MVTSGATGPCFGSSGFSAFGHVDIGAKHPVSVENKVTCGQYYTESQSLQETSPQQLCQANNVGTARFLVELGLTFLHLLWTLFLGWSSM